MRALLLLAIVSWSTGVAAAQSGVDSGEIATGASYALRFEREGVFEYYCHPHPAMTGRVVVDDAATEEAMSVLVEGYVFPAELRVRPGAVVNWTNGDPEAHTVTFVREGERAGDHGHESTPLPVVGLLAGAFLAATLRRRA